MDKKNELSNPPITEAIIDFKINEISEFPDDKLSNIEDEILSSYPKKERRKRFQGHFEVGDNKPPVVHEREDHYGYFFRSEDEFSLAQFRIDGFTYNRLKPYTSWEQIYQEAMRLWGLYTQIVEPHTVNRLAVRYINHIYIPYTSFDLSDYLTKAPDTPDNVSGTMTSFLTRVTFVEDQTGILANVTQSSGTPDPTKGMQIIIDLDVYKNGPFKLNNTNLQEIFFQLRDLKNRAFFGSITDKTVRLFDE